MCFFQEKILTLCSLIQQEKIKDIQQWSVSTTKEAVNSLNTKICYVYLLHISKIFFYT